MPQTSSIDQPLSDLKPGCRKKTTHLSTQIYNVFLNLSLEKGILFDFPRVYKSCLNISECLKLDALYLTGFPANDGTKFLKILLTFPF